MTHLDVVAILLCRLWDHCSVSVLGTWWIGCIFVLQRCVTVDDLDCHYICRQPMRHQELDGVILREYVFLNLLCALSLSLSLCEDNEPTQTTGIQQGFVYE